jgi:hypothetical protein
MHDDTRQDFRLDIFKLLRDELSVSVHLDPSGQAHPRTATLSGESLTRILREQFGFDDRRLCELGIDLAAHGRAALTLHCTQRELRAAHLMPPA